MSVTTTVTFPTGTFSNPVPPEVRARSQLRAYHLLDAAGGITAVAGDASGGVARVSYVIPYAIAQRWAWRLASVYAMLTAVSGVTSARVALEWNTGGAGEALMYACQVVAAAAWDALYARDLAAIINNLPQRLYTTRPDGNMILLVETANPGAGKNLYLGALWEQYDRESIPA